MTPDYAAANFLMAESEPLARVTHALAARIVGMGQEHGVYLIKLLQALYPNKQALAYTAEHIYQNCADIEECATIYNIIDGKVCRPDLFADKGGFTAMPLSTAMHKVMAEQVTAIRRTYQQDAEHVVSQLMDRITR